MKIALQLQAIGLGPSQVIEPLDAAISMLTRAYLYAVDAGVSPWQFAVEVDELRRSGIGNSEFRWLLAKGLISQAREIPSVNSNAGTFTPLSQHSFGPGTYFVVSEDFAKKIAESHEQKSVEDVLQLPNDVKTNLKISPVQGTCKSIQSNILPSWDTISRELTLNGLLVKKLNLQHQIKRISPRCSKKRVGH